MRFIVGLVLGIAIGVLIGIRAAHLYFPPEPGQVAADKVAPPAALKKTASKSQRRAAKGRTAAKKKKPLIAETEKCPGTINWSKAREHLGIKAIVKGPVLGTSYYKDSEGKPTYLNMGKPYPDPNRFTIVIKGENRAKFVPTPEKLFEGKVVCVTGVVESYRDIAQIEIRSPSDIVIEIQDEWAKP